MEAPQAEVEQHIHKNNRDDVDRRALVGGEFLLDSHNFFISFVLLHFVYPLFIFEALAHWLKRSVLAFNSSGSGSSSRAGLVVVHFRFRIEANG